MRWPALFTLCALLTTWSPAVDAEPRFHVVAAGHTLGKIAKRYNVSIEALCEVNRIDRRQSLKLGQKLVIPDKDTAKSGPAKDATEAKDAPESHTSRAAGGRKLHVVESGHTLIAIAGRYHVTVDALCAANGITRETAIFPGQELSIPSPDEASPKPEPEREPPPPPEPDSDARETAAPASSNSVQTLLVPGAPPAYFYEPAGAGRKSLRPVIMYLHGRGGNPKRDCQRWAKVARRLGWVVCPSGPEDRGGGARGWNNNWAAGQLIAKKTLDALRAKYGRRVQLYGNTIAGFSEGAFVAMNVGVREARSFNRWLILAADSDYWGGSGVETLQQRHAAVRRVYLITGQKDGVTNGTDEVRKWLAQTGVPTRVSIPSDMGHELALEKKPELYRSALTWLQKGGARSASGVAASGEAAGRDR